MNIPLKHQLDKVADLPIRKSEAFREKRRSTVTIPPLLK